MYTAYNVHYNELIVTLEDLCEILYYAYDTTTKCHGITVPEVKETALLLMTL